MSESTIHNKLLLSENGIVSLGDVYAGEDDFDLDYDDMDIANHRLLINSANNLKLEIKYPNIEKLKSKGNNSYLKNILLKVKPAKIDYKESSESSLCEQILGIYPNLAFDCNTNDYKIIIQGFLPKKFTCHSQQLKLGDMIISINEILVNSDNIELLLMAIRRPQTIKITALAPITYVNMNVNDLLSNPFVNPKKESLKTKSTFTKVVAHSKSTQVLQGDRVKCPTENLMDEFFYFVMVLSLHKESFQQQNEMNDLIYKFPSSGGELNRQNISINELIVTIRGMFMTLSCSMKDMEPNNHAVCCLIEHQDQLLNVCFLNQHFGNNGLLVLVVPSDQIGLDYLKVLATNLGNTIKFTFGDLFMQNTASVHKLLSGNSRTKEQLNAFFSQLKNRFLNRPGQNNKKENKTNSQRRLNFLLEIRSKFINSMPYLDLPTDLKCDLDATLSDIEAQEFVDLENNFYKNRRQYTIVGSCLFYKDFLISSHLASSNTKHVYDYCEHYGFFNLVKNGSTNQFFVWKEVFLSKNRPAENERHFLIVVGLKEFLFAIILESGGIISRQINANQLIEPDPFYIQQATYILTDIHDNGIMSEINRFYKFGPKQILFNINKFVTLKKKPGAAKTRANSKSKSPMRISIASEAMKTTNIQSGNEPKNLVTTSIFSSSENIYQFHKEQRHRSPSASLSTCPHTDASLTNKYFTDIALHESIIYYAHSDCMRNGILFPAKQYDFNSNLFVRVFYNFVQSCFKINALFESSFAQSSQSSNNHLLIEQGVLFNLIIDEQNIYNNKNPQGDKHKSGDQASSAKVKEMSFWVVGRRRMQRLSPADKWTNGGDFYLCFHDSIEQILLELAFDIGFAKMAF